MINNELLELFAKMINSENHKLHIKNEHNCMINFGDLFTHFLIEYDRINDNWRNVIELTDAGFYYISKLTNTNSMKFKGSIKIFYNVGIFTFKITSYQDNVVVYKVLEQDIEVS